MVLAGRDGQIRAEGAQGAYHADVRVLSAAVLRLDGREAEPIGHADAGAGRTRFDSVARWLGGPGRDPSVRIARTRTVTPGEITEEIRISSVAAEPVTTTVTLDLVTDRTPIEVVRSGGPDAPADAEGGTVTISTDDDAVSWAITLAPGTHQVLHFTVRVTDPAAVVHGPTRAHDWRAAGVHSGDRRLGRLVTRSLDDLHALRLSDGDDVYLAAGAPWYLTLFGRDSIWAARMLLPLGTAPAAGTLRVLARRQGTRTDPVSGEAPGKILHELRRSSFALGGGLRLPAAYYGSVDATPLWISLLHDAWRWGLPGAEVAALLPHLEAALGWLGGYAGGFLTYHDTSGHGLANQGWKDSADALRFAEPPIALVEAQAYAYRAALDGAALLDAFGRPGGDHWREYAAALAGRFRAAFWTGGGYPALALDRDGRPVEALTSNIGHLLGTGLLDAAEEQAVATALAGDAMSGGYGLRTMSALDRGFSPLSYHCGSVWAHDTAIVAAGLARAGFDRPAATLVDGLLAAGEAFGYRLPELHAGDARTELSRPMAYPAACRPQAWSAAAAVLMLQTAIGLEPDVPAGRVRLRPLAGAPFGTIEATGLEIAGTPVDVRVDAAGTATITGLPHHLTRQP
jgi:glycogen debranching enzyme